MRGHRRISTALFLEFADRSVPRSKIEALLELDLDEFKEGELRPERTYARMWGWSREKVRRLIADYQAHREDLSVAARGQTHPTTDRTTERPLADRVTDHRNRVESLTYNGSPTGGKTTDETGGRPETDHFLDPDHEPDRRGASLPVRPKAVGVGVADSRSAQVRAQIGHALMRAGPASADAQAERQERLEILGDMFLTSSRVPDASQLLGYARGVNSIPTELLRMACDAATGKSERGFVPSINAIAAEGRKLVVERRRRVQGGR